MNRFPGRDRRRKPKAARMLDALTPEASVQSAIIDYLQVCGWYVCHIPAGGADGAHLGRMERQGYIAGFPDLYCKPPDPDAPAVLIEVKRPGERESGVSSAQLESHRELRQRGQEVWVIDDADQLRVEYGIEKTVMGVPA